MACLILILKGDIDYKRYTFKNVFKTTGKKHTLNKTQNSKAVRWMSNNWIWRNRNKEKSICLILEHY